MKFPAFKPFYEMDDGLGGGFSVRSYDTYLMSVSRAKDQRMIWWRRWFG